MQLAAMACGIGILGVGEVIAQPSVEDWKALEAPLLTNHRQLTFRDRFVRAGESYVSPDGRWVIFQAVETPKPGVEADPFYAMFVGELGPQGGLTRIERVSPAGSANTCGWFHPTLPVLLFGSTVTVPREEAGSGYQRGTSRYRWAFPTQMEIVLGTSAGYAASLAKRAFSSDEQALIARAGRGEALFARPNYDAECTFDPTGRFVLYAHVNDAPAGADPANPPKTDADIYIFDTKTGKDRAIVVAPGYDGGPFFSPDGQWICYRSDRRGNDELQLFVAKLAFETGEDGARVPVGIEHEFQITDNAHVNWCPFYHPTGEFLVYATSEVGHSNYEVFAVRLDRSRFDEAIARAGGATRHVISDLPRARITHAAGADVLPAFTPDGKKMIWCSQRGGKIEGEARPSSQVWIADWNGTPFR